MYQSVLEEVRKKRRDYDLENQPGASPASLTKLREQARIELKMDVPEAYIRFLRLSDGLVWNGLEIYASEKVPLAGHTDRFIEGFVDANLDRRDVEACKELLIFGEGNIDLYVYNVHQRKHFILDRTSLDITEEADSFDSLIAKALEIHL
jgi:hypothetical protein